jgi:hypothetical protein
LWSIFGGWVGGIDAAASWLVGFMELISFIENFAMALFLGFKQG